MKKAANSSSSGERTHPRTPVNRDAAVGLLENNEASLLKQSPKTATVIKDSLRSNLSPVEATAQLRVLCRKFAALTEKVKEETKLREEAQREVRRLKELLDGNNAPVVASCRTDTQAFLRELKEANDRLKQDLRVEKDKNDMLVTKALELEREKNALLANQSDIPPSPPPSLSGNAQLSISSWDKEQVQKIQDTLKTTIDELQDELTRKEGEIESSRERFQRERSRVRALEEEIRAKEEAERAAARTRKQLEDELRQAQAEITSELENVQRVHERAQENRAMRDTLESQLTTLNEVNSALEQRCKALVRRLELAAGAAQEIDDLKLQIHDAEVDNETLVRTIRELKDQQFEREKQWKEQVECARCEKKQVEELAEELQADLAAVRAQNSLFSEWMLVRNENTLMTQQGDMNQASEPQRHGDCFATDCQRADQSVKHSQRAQHYRRYRSRRDEDAINQQEQQRTKISPIPESDEDDDISTESKVARYGRQKCSPGRLYVHTTELPNSQQYYSVNECNSEKRGKENEKTVVRAKGRRHQLASPASASTSSSVSPSSASSSASISDHERLRALMSRNRELQLRLQQETLATRSLEREITDLTY